MKIKNVTLDSVIEKLIDHDEKLGNIEYRLEKLDVLDDFMAGQDKMITILERVDQERIFTNEAIKRLEADVSRIKKHLHLV